MLPTKLPDVCSAYRGASASGSSEIWCMGATYPELRHRPRAPANGNAMMAQRVGQVKRNEWRRQRRYRAVADALLAEDATLGQVCGPATRAVMRCHHGEAGLLQGRERGGGAVAVTARCWSRPFELRPPGRTPRGAPAGHLGLPAPHDPSTQQVVPGLSPNHQATEEQPGRAEQPAPLGGVGRRQHDMQRSVV